MNPCQMLGDNRNIVNEIREERESLIRNEEMMLDQTDKTWDSVFVESNEGT